MTEPNLAELRSACIARGLCTAAAFDGVMRAFADPAAGLEGRTVLDALVIEGRLDPVQAWALSTEGFGPMTIDVGLRNQGTVVAGRASPTQFDLPSGAEPDGATQGFAPEDLRAALAASATPRGPQHAAPAAFAAPAPRRAANANPDATIDASVLDALETGGGAPAPAPDDAALFGSDLVGRTLGGCRVLRELGRGAMGVVFEATHLSLQRNVALKVLLPSARRSQRDVDQFFQEARSLARVEHPNIVQVYDVGEQEGLHYLTMQLLEGETVTDRLDRMRLLPWEEACRIARDAAKGLAVAHAKNIVHRDVKPENVFVTTDGVVKLADFGLAAQPSAADGARGEVMGTPAYMSPEQIDGRSVDGRADLYSIGCAMYVMLTGRKPFEGASAIEVMLKQTRETATPVVKLVPGVPLSVSQVVEKLMAKSPAARYAKADQLVADLENILGGGKPRVVVEIEDVMGRMQELMREADAPRSRSWGRPPVVVASAAVVIAAAAVLASVALPAVDVPDLGNEALAVGDDPEDVAERQAREALEAVDAQVRGLGPDAEAVRAAYDELTRRHGDALGAAISASRDRALGNVEKARDTRIAEVRSAASALLPKDPAAAVRTLLTLPSKLREGPAMADWTQDLEKALAALRAATGMTYVSGGRAPSGADGHPSEVSPFLIDVSEVSNAEYARFVAATGARAPAHWGGPEPPAAARDLPVVGVTAAEADAYAKWAGKRLPTAAEWERAARGPDGRAYPWGPDFDAARCVSRATPSGGLVPVLTLAGGRSPDGVFHMAGNAAEWTADVATDATLQGRREVRGGSSRSHPAQCTAYARYWVESDSSDPMLLIGFRCARDAE